MHSARFGLAVTVTEHAQQRMAERNISAELLLDIIDTGRARNAGGTHCWLYKAVPGRTDNVLCVAAVIDNVFVVKTVMHHWEPEP